MARIKNWKKYAPQNFVDSIESMSNEELRKIILQSSDMIERTNKEMDEDSTLKAAKERASDLEGAYKDTVRAYQSKIVGAIEILNQRRTPVDE